MFSTIDFAQRQLNHLLYSLHGRGRLGNSVRLFNILCSCIPKPRPAERLTSGIPGCVISIHPNGSITTCPEEVACHGFDCSFLRAVVLALEVIQAIHPLPPLDPWQILAEREREGRRMSPLCYLVCVIRC